jgi:hypothetical protein
MPPIDKTFLLSLHDDYTKYPCFIETGTHHGDTIFSIEPYFNNIYTIEYSDILYKKTKSKYTGNKINFLLGDSSIVFETLLPTITKPSIFFLDGHWSHGDTGKSNKDCPLDEEITHINNLFKNEAIIIIDDYRLFGLDKTADNGEDWKLISKENLINILTNRINKVYHLDSLHAKDDRLIIHINPIHPIT